MKDVEKKNLRAWRAARENSCESSFKNIRENTCVSSRADIFVNYFKISRADIFQKLIQNLRAKTSMKTLKNTCAGLLLAVVMTAWAAGAMAQTGDLQRATPESQGVSSKAVQSFFESMMAARRTSIHSIIVMRHGKVIAETYPKPFDARYRHTLFSCSKTFVSAAVGLAINDNRLRLTDRVVMFFPDEAPDSLTANLADMTVRDLLVMASGVQPDPDIRVERSDWARAFLSKPVARPGKKFKYDSLCTYMLSAIVQKVTGQTVLDYLRERLLAPMHITDAEWERSPEGYTTGGWGLYIQSESMAKFGQLLLDKGVWNGRRLLPETWVGEMMKKQIDNGSLGYGYQMWCCEHKGSMRADGMYGQFIYVLPDKDMVVVVTQCCGGDSGAERKLLWNVLLPGVKAAPLPATGDSKILRKRSLAYALPTVKGKAADKDDLAFAGKTLKLADNRYGWKTVTVNAFRGRLSLAVTAEGGKRFDIDCGRGVWLEAESDVPPVYSIYPQGRFNGVSGPFRIAACYAVDDRSRLVVRAHYVNWLTALELVFHPAEGGATIDVTENHGAKPYVLKGEYE